MRVLGIVHQPDAGPGVFAEAVAARGHELVEWRPAGQPVPEVDGFGAVIVLGGAMHPDHEAEHPWLAPEKALLRSLLERGTPILGVCLGAQLLAKAAHAAIYPARRPEIGWYPVEVTEDAADDPLFQRLPERFHAFQWHYYTYDLPASAVELARSDVCTQAFRLGERVWGIQFHAEVTRKTIDSWVSAEERDVPSGRERLVAETERRLGAWNAIGRELCGGFLEAAERVAAPA